MITLFLGIRGHADKFSGRLYKQLHDKFEFILLAVLVALFCIITHLHII